MESGEKIPEEFFSGIDEISIDASSIIYSLKVGILGYLSAEVSLISTEAIIEEVQWPRLPVKSHKIFENAEMTNDESVVELAKIQSCPVLSEDKEVLENARKNGLHYYNTLMMLNYLLLKQRITKKEYPEYLQRLIDISHYSEDILEYGTLLNQSILELLN